MLLCCSVCCYVMLCSYDMFLCCVATLHCCVMLSTDFCLNHCADSRSTIVPINLPIKVNIHCNRDAMATREKLDNDILTLLPISYNFSRKFCGSTVQTPGHRTDLERLDNGQNDPRTLLPCPMTAGCLNCESISCLVRKQMPSIKVGYQFQG